MKINKLTFSQLSPNQRKGIYIGIVLFAFLVGLIIPSPLSRRIHTIIGETDDDIIATIDTSGMVMPGGAVYEGSINAKTKEPHGFGVLTKPKSVYEGNWKKGRLRYGKRTTAEAVYEGRFDEKLNCHGFGIAHYTPKYINSKRDKGMGDNEIIETYIGNWNKNNKDGLGRAIKADSSMVFGHFKKGVFQHVDGANYKTGDKVFGIDVSHHQDDIDWDQLALYCDNNGNVYRKKPEEKKYMQPVFFAYFKATEGATWKDGTYDVRATEAERHGIVKGAYHFLRLGSGVEEQIKNFVEKATWTSGDLPPALDIEVEEEIRSHGTDKFLDMTFTWLEAIERQMNVKPIIYTTENIRDKYLTKDPRFKNYSCWITRFRQAGPENEDWKIWQMTENGRMKGYNGNVDINMYKNDYKSFISFLRQSANPED